jgi:GTP:adenosylcobinamide-phosphate guanylyltransferase
MQVSSSTSTIRRARQASPRTLQRENNGGSGRFIEVDKEAPIPAVVLAGSSSLRGAEKSHPADNKCLWNVMGKALVEYVVQALHQAGCTPICVATSEDVKEQMQRLMGHAACVAVASGPAVSDTLLAGMAVMPSAKRILVATGDLPLLTAEAVDHFLSEALASGAELVYSIVRRQSLTGTYALGERLFVPLNEGEFSGGNLFLMSPDLITRCVPVLKRMYAARKKPIAMARLIGLPFLLRFLVALAARPSHSPSRRLCVGALKRLGLHPLDIPSIIHRAEQLLHCTASVVISPYPEVCFDVDKPSDLRVAEAILAERTKE